MFSLEEAIHIMYGDCDEQYNLVQYDGEDWEGDKYQVKSVVIQDTNTGKFYEVTVNRTGDYEYIGHDVVEVEPKTVTIVKYVPVEELSDDA